MLRVALVMMNFDLVVVVEAELHEPAAAGRSSEVWEQRTVMLRKTTQEEQKKHDKHLLYFSSV